MRSNLETVPLLFSLEEAASLLKLSSKTIRKLIKAGKAPCINIGSRRLIPRSWLVKQGVGLTSIDGVDLIDVKLASRTLGISPRHLWTFTYSGEIPNRRLGERTLRYSIAELKDWIESQIAIKTV